MAEPAKTSETIVYGGGGPAPPPVLRNMSSTPPDERPTKPPRPTFDSLLPVMPGPPDLTGTLLLDRYKLLRKLGVGGMGTVYEAEHVTLKKRCAIKILNPEFAHRPELVERFLQEARAASMIAHENVVEITDFGATPSGSVFFVMEMLIGEDLADTIRREAPLSWPRATAMVLQICRALQAAHDKGIVHRDMKPENVFRVERSGNPDFVKVLDFGIAKVTTEDPEGSGARLTSTGMIFGTPTYMSPEQAQGERVDHRSDIYAVGVILYELVTGKVPFHADNFMGILTKHMFEDPLAPTEAAPDAGITPEMEAVILKAMQKDRGLRFESMRALMDAILDVGTGAEAVTWVPERRPRPTSGALTQFARPSTGPMRVYAEPTLESLPPRRRGLGLLLVALLAVAAGSGAAALYFRGEDPPPPSPVLQDSTLAAVAAPIVAPTPEPPAPEPEPAQPASVRVTLEANVPAEVFDADGATRLGATGEPLALTGEGPHRLLLRAAGHDDLQVELAAPADGQRAAYTLKASAKKKPGGTKVASGKPAKTGDAKPATPPAGDAPKPDDKPSPSGSKFGLKNPFETRSK